VRKSQLECVSARKEIDNTNLNNFFYEKKSWSPLFSPRLSVSLSLCVWLILALSGVSKLNLSNFKH